jgi:hypothetical protein
MGCGMNQDQARTETPTNTHPPSRRNRKNEGGARWWRRRS